MIDVAMIQQQALLALALSHRERGVHAQGCCMLGSRRPHASAVQNLGPPPGADASFQQRATEGLACRLLSAQVLRGYEGAADHVRFATVYVVLPCVHVLT